MTSYLKHIFTLQGIFYLGILLSSCTAQSLSELLSNITSNEFQDPNFDARISQLLATNVLQLAHDIGHVLLNDSTAKSEIFSPISIYGALNLLLLGANGDTYTELLQLINHNQDPYLSQNSWKIHEELGILLEDIGRDEPNPKHPRNQYNWKINPNIRPAGPSGPKTLDDPNDVGHVISIANGVFIQDGFTIRPDYLNAVRDIYKSYIENLDFTEKSADSTKYINEWVSNNTHGKIKDIIQDTVSDDTKLIIASVLYFQARWERTFLDGATMPRNFYPDGLSEPPITVEMMAHGGTFPYYDAKEYDCRILGLPYKQNLTTMYIILPNNSTRQKLRQLQSELTADKIEDMISKLEWKTAIILFPKMHVTNRFNLEKILPKLGVSTIFNSASSDLSLITSDGELIGTVPIQPLAVPMQPIIAIPSDVGGRLSKQDLPKYPGYEEHSEVPLVFHKKRRSLKTKRQINSEINTSQSVKNLNNIRNELNNGLHLNPGLYASEIVHQIDLTINEKGTEGGAATVTLLYRTGTDTVFRVEAPFMFLIRHDDTKLPLFYGAVYEPENLA